jgi:hypothetical protein
VGTGDNVAERSKLDIESYVNKLAETVSAPGQPRLEEASVSLESALKGRAVELWSNAAGRLFIVADEEDAPPPGGTARHCVHGGRGAARNSDQRFRHRSGDSRMETEV